MNKTKLITTLFLAVALFAAVVVQAESDRQVQPAKIKPKAAAEIQSVRTTLTQTSPLTGSKQGYKMVTDVLDGFGGESESDNYRIPVNSGGQPSAVGISESDNYVLEAGYVHASFVMRGDANGDGVINVTDIVYLINYLFNETSPPDPLEAGDANCDGKVDVVDIVYLINYLFGEGPPPCNL